MIDTHTHIYLEEFDADRDAVVQRALEAGVERMILPNVDCDTIAAWRALHEAYPQATALAMGLHPTSVDENYEQSLATTLKMLREESEGYVAVGEIGLDLYWDRTFINEQKIVLSEQLRMARQLGLPAIIHCREALDEIIATFSDCDFELPEMVFHSFTGMAEDVDRLRECGDFYFGFNGIVTFKKSNLDETVKRVGLDRILLETDAPYLAPVPHRGKRNEAAYVVNVAAKIAEIMEVDTKAIDEITTANAHRLFKKL